MKGSDNNTVISPENTFYEALKVRLDNSNYFKDNKFVGTAISDNDIKLIKAAQILSETHGADSYKDKLASAIKTIKDNQTLNVGNRLNNILNETDFKVLLEENPLVSEEWEKYNTSGISPELLKQVRELEELEELIDNDTNTQNISNNLTNNQIEEKEIEEELENDENNNKKGNTYVKKELYTAKQNQKLQNLQELGDLRKKGTRGNGNKEVYTEAQKDAAAKKIQKLMIQKTNTVYQATKDLKSAMNNSDVKEAISKKKQEIMDTLTEKQYESLYNTKTNAEKIIKELDQTIEKIKEIDVTSKLKNPVSSIDLPKPSDSKYTKALKKKTPSQWMREQKEGKGTSGGLGM